MRPDSTRLFVAALLLALIATLDVSAAARSTRAADSARDILISDHYQNPPTLVFACDGATPDLDRLFSQPDVLSDLQSLHAGISLSLPEMTPDRARLVLKLNHAGIPVTAWLALPPGQGYYLNSGNAPQASARFAEFQTWTQTFGLRWAGVGLDIEPNLQDFAALKQGSRWRLVLTLVRRYFDVNRVNRARQSYAALVHEIQARGYPVDTYQFPFLADQRRVHSTLLERLAGIVDIRGDREVLMLYTSFNHSLDSALIWVYGPDAQAIAVGVVSDSDSNSDTDSRFSSLTWQEFSRDLLVAHHFSQVLGVYNLQGCVHKGFLHRLTTMSWDQSIVLPAQSVHKATQLRTRIQRAIWIASHLPWFALILLIAIVLFLARRLTRG